MERQKDRIWSLNKTSLGNLSIEELESRLQMEELDTRGEMWTGCDCVDFSIQPPTPQCPPITGCSCVAVGTW